MYTPSQSASLTFCGVRWPYNEHIKQTATLFIFYLCQNSKQFYSCKQCKYWLCTGGSCGRWEPRASSWMPAANAFCFRIRYNCVYQQYLIHVEEKGLPPSHTFPQSCAFSNNLVGAINPIHVRIAVISNLCLSHFDFPPPVGNFSFLLTMTKSLLCDLNGCQHGHRSVVFSL